MDRSSKELKRLEEGDMHEPKTKEDDKMLSCFCRGQRTGELTKRHDYSDDVDSDDGEPEKTMCIMS